jgi:hypothetical protein
MDRAILRRSAEREHGVRRSLRRAVLIKMLAAGALLVVARPSWAGNAVNSATTGAAGTTVVISNSAATQLLKANGARFGWTVYCSGTAGTIAALMMPGDSSGNAASPAPSQTVGFPIPANTLINDQDFILRGVDSMHQRIDAEAQGSSSVNCYTWEEN